MSCMNFVKKTTRASWQNHTFAPNSASTVVTTDPRRVSESAEWVASIDTSNGNWKRIFDNHQHSKRGGSFADNTVELDHFMPVLNLSAQRSSYLIISNRRKKTGGKSRFLIDRKEDGGKGTTYGDTKISQLWPMYESFHPSVIIDLPLVTRPQILFPWWWCQRAEEETRKFKKRGES